MKKLIIVLLIAFFASLASAGFEFSVDGVEYQAGSNVLPGILSINVAPGNDVSLVFDGVTYDTSSVRLYGDWDFAPGFVVDDG